MKIATFFRNVRTVLMIALVACCVNLCVCAVFLPQLQVYVWRFVGVYLIFSMLSLSMPGKLRILPALLGVAAMIVPVVLYTEGQQQLFAGCHSLAYSIVLILTLQLSSWGYNREPPSNVITGGFLVIGMCCIFITFQKNLLHLLPVSKLFAIVYVLLALLSYNRNGWLVASGGRYGYSRAMRWKNRGFALGAFLLALIPARFLTPAALFGRLWEWFRKVVADYLYSWEATESPPIIEIESGRTELVGEGDLQPMLRYLIILLICLGIYFILVLVISMIRNRSRKRALSLSLDFSDEITNTRKKRAKAAASSDSQSQPTGRRPFFFGRMDPTQQIRYRYRQLARKNPQWTEQSTARENLRDPAAGIYEQARYSPHPVTAAHAAQFKKETAARKRP